MKLRLCALMVLAFGSAGALAYGAVEDYGMARVISAKPVYETVDVPETREVCRDEPVTYYEGGRRPRNSETNEALGLVLGGLIGNQFGSGSGRAAATVGGAVLGSAIARDSNRNRYESSGRRVTRHEEVCEVRESYRTERELVGYDVTYDYNGTVGHTFSSRRPGKSIRVRVAVEAVEP